MILKTKIKKIIDAIKDTEISEIEISSFWGLQKIKLKKGFDYNIKNENMQSHNTPPSAINITTETKNATENSNNVQESLDPSSSDTVTTLSSESEPIEKEYTIIKAPLVGTFYLSPKPGQPPFVEVGANIKSGDTLCIVEAMKIFNEIESEYSGVIKEILVQDGQPVEFDQPLFKIEEL